MKSRAAALVSALFGLAAFGLSACDQVPAAAPPTDITAAPALWRISDSDTTVYFFGAVHVLPPDLQWHSDKVDKAFEEAKAVYFETDMEPDRYEFTAIVDRLGKYDPSDRLADHLTPQDLATVEAGAKKLDVPMVLLQPMRPWYAGNSLSEIAITHSGYDPNSGVERTFLPLARKEGKELRKFETLEDQMESFATLPEQVQVRYLVEGMSELDTMKDKLAEMVNTWKKGDTVALQRILIDEDLGMDPAIYTALLANRNAAWAPVIDKLMKSETGTFFVAVGAAHLIGKDSVFEKLKPMGYNAERVQ